MADFILVIASGVVTTQLLDGEESRLHCIACAERYLASRPLGYIQGGDVGEGELGFSLWTSAQVNVMLCCAVLLCLALQSSLLWSALLAGWLSCLLQAGSSLLASIHYRQRHLS